MSKVSFEGGEITYKYLFNKTKHNLCVDYLNLLDNYLNIQKKLNNNSCNECSHEYKYLSTTPFVGYRCAKCGKELVC